MRAKCFENSNIQNLENDIMCESYILEKCGHSPFVEKYAKDEFYKILLQIIN